MNKKVISEKQVGEVRKVATTYPIYNQLIRVAWETRRPSEIEWIVVVGLCNGTADYDRSFHTKKDAKEFFDTINEWGLATNRAEIKARIRIDQ